MLRSGTILMIREKAESGESAYAIGKELRISKNTAHKYIERKEDAPLNMSAAFYTRRRQCFTVAAEKFDTCGSGI